MNPTGLVILIAGVWVTCQVLGGNALQRLNILAPESDKPSGSGVIAGSIAGSVNGVVPGMPNNPVTPWGILGGALK